MSKLNTKQKILFPGDTILQGMPELAYVFNNEGKMLMWKFRTSFLSLSFI